MQYGCSLGAMTAGMVYLGLQTGLFRTLKKAMTAPEVAHTSGLEPLGGNKDILDFKTEVHATNF